jgi:hypothetical protein
MQPGSARFSVSTRAFAVIAAVLAPGLPAQADEFEAFTWARHHPASTDHVSPLIQVDPWANLEDVAARLKALPAGKRFVIFQWIADDLADHPQDRVVQRTWQLRTRQAPAPTPVTSSPNATATKTAATTATAVSAVARGTAVSASRGRAPASAVTPAAAMATTAPRMITVTERVPVDRLTEFRGPWMDNGINTVRARVQSVMSRLKSLGAPIDGIAIGNETTLHAACFLGHAGSLAAIEADPRWPALAQSVGLPLQVSGMTWGSDLYFRWTERMAGRFDAAMNQAVFQSIRAFYPSAVVSNYCSGRLLSQFASPDINGHLDRRQTSGFGTHDNFEFYGWLAHWRIEKARGTAPVDPAWLAFRVEMHKIRGMNASSQRPKHAWIAQRSWQGESWGPVAFDSDPLWDETVLQLGMHGVRQFFELSIEDFGTTREANLERRAADRSALDSLLAQLNARVSGSSGGVLTAVQPSWNDQVIATGRRVGDRVVWRFSFAPGVDAVRVRFNDGSEATVIAEEGRRGAWFEHPATVQLQLDSTGRMPLAEPIEVSGNGGNEGTG